VEGSSADGFSSIILYLESSDVIDVSVALLLARDAATS
jgi:hypothetical protein